MFGIKTRRRNRLRSQPFPDDWLAILRRNVPYYEQLAPPDQEELRGNIQVFVAEKNIEGCGGLAMTDEIKVTVAAFACILLLHRRHDFYPRLQTVVVYPDAYPAPVQRRVAGPVVFEGQEIRAGESWRTGAVVLSWNHVQHHPSVPGIGHNVALHEFAHQLDLEDGAVDGAPALPTGSRYAAWARILGREFETLSRDAAAGRPTVLDVYGATEPAEFFAVATECFFERPQPLRERHPALYGELKQFYRQDPAAQS